MLLNNNFRQLSILIDYPNKKESGLIQYINELNPLSENISLQKCNNGVSYVIFTGGYSTISYLFNSNNS